MFNWVVFRLLYHRCWFWNAAFESSKTSKSAVFLLNWIRLLKISKGFSKWVVFNYFVICLLLLLLWTVEITKITKAVVTRLLGSSGGWSIFKIAKVTEPIILINFGLFECTKVSKIAKPIILRWLMLDYWRWHHWLLA